MQFLVSSLSGKWLSCATAKEGLLPWRLQKTVAECDDTRGFICTICVLDLLMMGGMRSKHVEDFNYECNLCKWTRNLCIKLVIIKKLYYVARPTKYQKQILILSCALYLLHFCKEQVLPIIYLISTLIRSWEDPPVVRFPFHLFSELIFLVIHLVYPLSKTKILLFIQFTSLLKVSTEQQDA